VLRRVTLTLVLALAGALLGAASAPAQSQSLLKLSSGLQILQNPQPALTPSPADAEFGSVDIHGNAQRQTITFEDNSPQPIEEQIRSVEIVGTQASSFQIANDYCSGHTFQMSPESCTVEVSFAPGAPVAEAATLELTMKGEENEDGVEEPGEAIEVPLSGEGVVGTLSPNQSALSFAAIPYSGSGAHEEGGNNETEEISIEDSGDAGAEIESVSIAGPGASSYSTQWDDCEHDYMQPNNTCTIGIRFEPVALGANEAQLVISSDATNSPLTIPLQGEGLHGPKIDLSSTQALLGEVALGASAWHTFTLTNTGDYRLGVQQAFLVSGTPLMFPVLSDTCGGQVIAPGASCALTVGFQPTTLGEKDASVIIITSSALPVSVVGVDGIGVQPAAAPQAPVTQAAVPAVASPSASSPTPPTPSDGTPLPMSAPASGDASQWLTLPRSARVLDAYADAGEATLETGADALCPVAEGACEVQGFVTATVPARAAGRAAGDVGETVLLGASTTRLAGGSSARVRIPLLGRAIDLLSDHGQVKATIGFLVRAGGTTVAARTRSVTLTGLPATAARTARRRPTH
jgi:hypothetical protein